MTNQQISSKLARMKPAADLFDPLERRLGDVLARLETLHAQNLQLSNRVQALETEKRHLAEKIDTTAKRLEALQEHLPEAL